MRTRKTRCDSSRRMARHLVAASEKYRKSRSRMLEKFVCGVWQVGEFHRGFRIEKYLSNTPHCSGLSICSRARYWHVRMCTRLSTFRKITLSRRHVDISASAVTPSKHNPSHHKTKPKHSKSKSMFRGLACRCRRSMQLCKGPNSPFSAHSTKASQVALRSLIK